MTIGKRKIQLENGEIKTITPLPINITQVKKDLEKLSGLKFGKGDLVCQAVGMATAWTCNHGPKDKDCVKTMTAAIFVAAYHFINNCGGHIVTTVDETSKVLVYAPHAEGHYIVNVEDLFDSLMFHEEFDIENDLIMEVKAIGNKKDLNAELNTAIKYENYEYAAQLRDRINKK